MSDFSEFLFLERNRRRKIRDKINGIYNRVHIIESDIIKAQKHIMKKYKLDEIDALTKLFNLVIDKKIELVLDKEEYKKSYLEKYTIKNIEEI